MVADAASQQPREREVEREVHREVPRDGGPSVAPPRGEAYVLDASGVRWRVSEVSGRAVPGARGETCLVFESDTAIRRVWHYPPTWRELPAPELIRVSWGR